MLNKKTYYLLGLGSGMIIGALLIWLMSAGESPQAIDEAMLEEAAKRYGYRLVDENSEVRFGTETVIHAVYINSEMSIEDISEMFATMSLIDDQALFAEALQAAAREHGIHTGYHEFRAKPTREQLVRTITGQAITGQ